MVSQTSSSTKRFPEDSCLENQKGILDYTLFLHQIFSCVK